MRGCCGLAGDIFGHRFQEFEVRREETPPPMGGLTIESAAYLPSIIEAGTTLVVENQIRCRRCGAAPDKEGA